MTRYANSADTVPEPCVIANTVMRPFSLGHHLLLKRLGLPFAGAPLADAAPGDIALGIAICATRYNTALAAMLSGEWDRMVAQWRRRAVGHWWNRKRVNWKEAEELFRAYLAAGYTKPPVRQYQPGSDSLEITAPWEELLLCRLVGAGFAADAVLEEYLPASWYHYYTAVEISRAAACRDASQWRAIFITKAFAEAYNGC